MRKIFKPTAALLLGTAIAACGVSPMTGAAIEPTESLLVDDAQLLTVEEQDVLTEEIMETADFIDMNILVYVSGSHVEHSDTQMYCEMLCQERYDMDEDSVVLYMDLSGHDDRSYSPYDFFYTRNRARFYYTDDSYGGSNRIQDIFSEINPYLPRCEEDIPGAVEEFLSELEYYYNYGPDTSYYYYVPDTGKYVTIDDSGNQVFSDSPPREWGLALVIGIVVSLIITLITFFCIKSHYRFKDAPSSLHYLSFEGAKINVRSDTFLRKYQTRRKIERSSGGGGGGFSGTSSGGGGGGNSR